MKTATKTRTQRRMEKKQALFLLVLVLVVSLASFTLGVIVGKQGAGRDLAQDDQVTEEVMPVRVPVQPKPLVASPPVKTEPTPVAPAVAEPPVEKTKLTFYDNLAKDGGAPLGSGINLAPQKELAKPVSKPPIDLPAKPIVKKTAAQVVAAVRPVAEGDAPAAPRAELPTVDPQGSFSVQVGSFAAAADAGKLKQQLVKKGYPAFMVEADLGNKGIWYRVRVGPYANGEKAKSMQLHLEEQDKIKGFISRQ